MVSSSKLCPTASASNTGAPALPLDVLFEVLLRLPAKDLCRLRAVCRSWCALTKDPRFVAEHKSRHTEPLFAVTFSNAWGVAIVGLSGQPIRRIPAFSNIEVLETHLDRLCAFGFCKPQLGAWVLNPATAGALALPGLQHSDEFVGICRDQISVGGFSDFIHKCWEVTYAFGQVASTREYKVLRISHPTRSPPLLCDIITLDGSNQERWRRKQNAPSGLIGGTRTSYIRTPLTVNGVVYFMLDYAVMERASTAPFNLDTENWMPTLRGPEPLRRAEFWDFDREISLANLNGSLVIFDDNHLGVFNLWFLMDHNRGLWVKKYRLSIQSSCIDIRPLLILDDGRIVIYNRPRSMLQCYDPTTDSLNAQKKKKKKTPHTNVLDFYEMGHGFTESIAVYTGSLLI